MPWWGLLLILAAILVAVLYGMHKWSQKIQKRHDEQQEQIESYKQTYSLLVIDKKKMRLQDADFPEYVLAQMPRYSKLFKFPVVKAKVGPKIMSFIAEKAVFEQIPVKKEIKADISGLYITGIKSVRGGLANALPPKKESKFEQLLKKGRGEA